MIFPLNFKILHHAIYTVIFIVSLDRINQPKSLQNRLNYLKNLQKNHLLNIPFENLDIHLNTHIKLDMQKNFIKIVNHNRGGFCYELNGLFCELLKSLNFEAKMISARVFDPENGYGNEFDHMAIIATLDEKKYLCDVGFGEFTFEPLELIVGEIQKDIRGIFMIDKFNEQYYRVSKIVNGTPMPKYIFKTEKRELNEFKAMCEHHQTNPESHFTKKRIISRPTAKGRISISGNLLKIKEGKSEKEIWLNNENEFNEKLKCFFNIEINQ